MECLLVIVNVLNVLYKFINIISCISYNNKVGIVTILTLKMRRV